MSGKHGMESLILELNEVKINVQAIPVHMDQGQKETKQIKYKYKTPTLMVHKEQINKTTTLCLPKE